MFKKSEDSNSVTFSFSSEMHLVDRVIQECREYLNKYNISEFSKFRLVLRELLINAVEHGNWNDPERTVTCCIYSMGKWQFRIVVADEGFGVDPDELDSEIPQDPGQPRSRGYPLIKAFTDYLEFNERGNQITAYMSLPQPMDFIIRQEDDRQIITPAGDLTASSAERFRSILVELLDQGYRRFCFDFINVEDIDSVALSVMIIFAKMLNKKNEKSRLEIINAGKAVSDLFCMTRMDKIYKLKNEA